MASKNSEKIENPPTMSVCSSEEDEEVSGSSEKESYSSVDKSKNEVSLEKPDELSSKKIASVEEEESGSSEEESDKPVDKSKNDVSLEKTDEMSMNKIASEEEEDSGSSSEEEEEESVISKRKKEESGSSEEEDSPVEKLKKEDSLKNIVVTKPRPETSKSSDFPVEKSKNKESLKKIVVTKPTPETSKSSDVETLPAKRSLEIAEELSKKKMKKASSEAPKQDNFQRVFAEDDDLVLLQAVLDFTATNPKLFKNIDAFHESVKGSISFHPTTGQIKRKIRKLRETFYKVVKNPLKTEEDQIVFSKPYDQRCFELSRQIWGVNGVFSKSEVKPSKLKNKCGGKRKEQDEEARDVVSFLKAQSDSRSGLEESTLLACWENVEDGATKRELEQRVQEIKAEQAKLDWKKFELVVNIGKMMFRDHASSSRK